MLYARTATEAQVAPNKTTIKEQELPQIGIGECRRDPRL